MPEMILNKLDSAAGWSGNGSITAEVQNFREYISGNRSASVMLRIPAGSRGKYIEISLGASQDVSNFDDIVFSMISFKKPVYGVSAPSDAAYVVSLDNGQDFLVASPGLFSSVDIPVDGYSSVSRFRLVVNHDGADVVIVSNLLAVKDGLPADILEGVKAGLEIQRDRLVAPGIEIGTVTAAAGAARVTVDTDWSWLEKNVVLTIGTGDDAEIHQVLNRTNNEVTFNSMFDGLKTKKQHNAAKVYISFPVEIGYYDREVQLPGVALWYSSPTPVTRNSRAEVRDICIGPLGMYRKRDGQLQTWRIQFEVAARSPELAADAARACRAFLATSTLWVHGRKLWFEWTEPAVDNEPVEGYDIVPRASYVIDVEVREDSWECQRQNPGSLALAIYPIV